MTQRVRDGLGLPAGLYRVRGVAPTFYVPNGITADNVASIVVAVVTPVEQQYAWVYSNGNEGFIAQGEGDSLTYFNNESVEMCSDVLHQIWSLDHEDYSTFPYNLETSSSYARVINDLSTLQAEFFLDV